MEAKKNFWGRKLFWGITIGEAAVVLGFYLFMAITYKITINLNSRSFLPPGEPLFAFSKAKREFADYAIKLLLTIPIWWFIFRVLRKLSLGKKLLVHLAGLPLFVFGWKEIFYYVCEQVGWGHLTSDGEIWDIYIPALFYILQFGVFHMYHYYKQLREEQRVASELRQLSLQGEMNALRAQIQPHFLFNTLNSISASVPSQLEHTRELIHRLAETFRFALNYSDSDFVPLRKELDFIRAYLELEKERFSDRLKVEYEIVESTLKTPVPPMLLQPLIENALQHGISKSVEGGLIKISIKPLQNNIVIEISDTGAGLTVTAQEALTKGIGLRNTNQRLQRLYGKSIQIGPNRPSGAKVYFEIPRS